jgi:hypothetical protein
VRQGALRFALPITTGTRPGVADYLPAPHGLPGFAVPVEQNVPALVPYLELADGRTIVATDGADEIHPSPDGRALQAIWRRWAQTGTKSGQFIDPALTSEVRWTIGDGVLTRSETLTARAPITIRAWRMTVPTTASTFATTANGVVLTGGNTVRSAEAGSLKVSISTPWKTDSYVRATGNDVLGRGARGAIPLHLMYEARDVVITPGQPVTWEMTLRPGL